MNTLTFRPRRSRFAAALLSGSILVTAAAGAQPNPAVPTVSQSAGVTAPALTDIRDIRGPKPIPSPWLMALVAMTAVLAAGGAYGAWTWNRRRLRESVKQPLDIALERLANARELMTPLRAREFSTEVSATVRDYIESRFEVRASHLTTHEFLHRLLEPADALLTAHRTLLDNFLQTCDLAKFGGWNLAAPDMEAMLLSARRFVVESAADTGSHRVRAVAAAAAAPTPTSASRETYVSLPST